jgi:hypothetical protein
VKSAFLYIFTIRLIFMGNQMNYKNVYDALVSRAKNRIVEGYTELHHIIPKCMGGDNSNDNLVRLTAREHYIAHELLFKHYRTTKLAHAWFSMVRCDPNQQRYFTARQYDKAKKAHSEALKISMLGANNHFFGRKHSAETKKLIGEKNRGETRSPEQVAAWIENVAKKPKTAEHRSKIGRSNMIMLKNINTGESIRVNKCELSKYNRDVWKNPAAIKQRRETCIHCGVETVAGNIRRWHNENCKHNPSREKESI